MKDLCLNCGKIHKFELWGAECDCNNPNTIHLHECNNCKNLVGFIMCDDFHGPEKLYCSDCIKQILEV